MEVPTVAVVTERLRQLILEVVNVPAAQVTSSATIDGELQMQSVAFVELQVAIEEEYDIQIDPIRVVELNQFSAIVEYVHALILGK